MLDGTNDEAALITHLLEANSVDAVAFLREGVRVTDAAELAACAREHLARSLQFLERAGVREG